MTPTISRKTNRDSGRHYFEQFAKAYALPNGVPEYGDKPDVTLKSARTIGVEMTNFYLQSGGSSGSEQRQRPLRQAVVTDAQNLFRGAGGRKFELSIGFNPEKPITSARKKILPKELAALAASISANGSGLVNGDLFERSSEVSFVYLNSKEHDDAKWSVAQVHAVDLMPAAGLAEIVREKEAKATEYARCDAYWLLIIVD